MFVKAELFESKGVVSCHDLLRPFVRLCRQGDFIGGGTTATYKQAMKYLSILKLR